MTLLELIDSYGYKLEKRGLEHWMHCPFHKDTDPSFSVTPTEKGHVWFCFGCKLGGGPVQFISYQENVSHKEAKRRWDKLNGKEVAPAEQNPLIEVVDALHLTALESGRFWDYMTKRGVEKSTVERYRLGYCESWPEMAESLGLDEKECDRLGLWDFTDSVVFPYFEDGEPFRLQARSIEGKSYKTKKGEGFRHALWGLDQVRGQEILLVEGMFDCLVAHQHGIQTAALGGVAMHQEYWRQLRERNMRRVTFCPDGDDGGRLLFRRLLTETPTDFEVRYVALRKGDVDEWLSSGKRLPEPQLPLEWFVGHKYGAIYSLEQKVTMVQEVAPYFVRLPRWVQSFYLEWFSKNYGEEVLPYLYTDLPPDFHAERIVLGNCLYSEAARLLAVRELDEKHFHLVLHRQVFAFIRDSDAPTPELIKSEFGVELDADLLNYKLYVAKVHEVRVGELIAGKLHEARSRLQASSSSEVVGELVEGLYQASESGMDVLSGGEIAKSYMATLHQRIEDPKMLGIPLNTDAFPVLNNSLLGLVPNKLILVSGITGHGKTNLVCNVIDDLVFEKGVNTLFASLEMTPPELVERQMTIRTGIASTKLMTGSVEQSEYNTIADIAKRMLNNRLRIIYGVYGLHKLVAIIRSQIMRNKVRVVCLDYVQLVLVENKKDRWEQLMEVTQTIKTRVCTMGVTVLLVSQLRRAALNSDIPSATDQAGSFGMLADPDVAITIKRRTGAEIQGGSNFLIYIDKHRYGVDSVPIDCVFDRQTLRIKEVLA